MNKENKRTEKLAYFSKIEDIIAYINEVNPSHTDISIWTIGTDYIKYYHTIDDDIMRLSDDGRVLKDNFDKWLIKNKRDKQIDKILL
jgi:hypothetical protein